MSRIRSKNTKPEIALRKALYKNGFRYRLHKKTLPGKPDLVFSKYSTAIFIHGCFWHLHNNCRDGRLPKSRLDYWGPKLQKNVERDQKHILQLEADGWKVLVIWECEITKDIARVIATIEKILNLNPK